MTKKFSLISPKKKRKKKTCRFQIYVPPVEHKHAGLNEHGLKWYKGSNGTSEHTASEAEATNEIRIIAQDFAKDLVASFSEAIFRLLHGRLRKICKI